MKENDGGGLNDAGRRHTTTLTRAAVHFARLLIVCSLFSRPGQSVRLWHCQVQGPDVCEYRQRAGGHACIHGARAVRRAERHGEGRRVLVRGIVVGMPDRQGAGTSRRIQVALALSLTRRPPAFARSAVGTRSVPHADHLLRWRAQPTPGTCRDASLFARDPARIDR